MQVWMHFMTQQRPSRQRRGLGAAAAAVLRHRMAHVVRVLRVFLKQDVVERGFAALRVEVAEATTFLQVQRAHAGLLLRLKEQTFLTTPGVCEQIEAILQGAGLLCRYGPQVHAIRMLKSRRYIFVLILVTGPCIADCAAANYVRALNFTPHLAA